MTHPHRDLVAPGGADARAHEDALRSEPELAAAVLAEVAAGSRRPTAVAALSEQRRLPRLLVHSYFRHLQAAARSPWVRFAWPGDNDGVVALQYGRVVRASRAAPGPGGVRRWNALVAYLNLCDRPGDGRHLIETDRDGRVTGFAARSRGRLVSGPADCLVPFRPPAAA